MGRRSRIKRVRAEARALVEAQTTAAARLDVAHELLKYGILKRKDAAATLALKRDVPRETLPEKKT